MKRAVLRGAVLGAMMLLALGSGVHMASAQVPPPPPLPPIPFPTIPPQAHPVFEILAPTLYPQCGTATLVVILGGQSAPQLASDLFSAASPVFVICGQVPRPGTQLQCILDNQQQAVLAAAIAQAGASVPLGLHPEGDLVEQTITIEDQLPAQVKALGAGKAVASILGCAPITYPTNPQGDYSSAPSYQPPLQSGYTLPSVPGTAIVSPYTSSPGALTPVLQQPPARTTPTGEAVRYAAIWLLPLALMMFGGYFGGALTREVDPAVFS